MSWTLATFSGWPVNKIKYVNGLFCLIGLDSGGMGMRIDTSPDGTTWTHIPGNGQDVFPIDGNGQIQDVIHDGTNWIVAGQGTGIQVYYSASIDIGSAAWKAWDVGFCDTGPTDRAIVSSIVYTGINPKYIITGENTLSGGLKNIGYSNSAPGTAVFTLVDTSFGIGSQISYSSTITPNLIAIGSGGTLTSSDGITWTPLAGNPVFVYVTPKDASWLAIGDGVAKINGSGVITYPIFGQNTGRYVAYGNNKLWAIGAPLNPGDENAYYLPAGGTSWIPGSTADFGNLSVVAFGNGKFVTIGNSPISECIQYTT
jgi:hypothetical protein